MRYKFYASGNKVVCVSSYAKRAVRGVAKCNTEQDTFELEVGKKLAQLRCDKNIAVKRHKRAGEQYVAAMKAYEAAEANMLKMRKYFEDSQDELMSATANLEAFESSI